MSIGSRAWLRYLLAVTVEAASGNLPWRLTRFLTWSYGAGLLRISGPAYQYRHDTFRVWLKSGTFPAAGNPRHTHREGG